MYQEINGTECITMKGNEHCDCISLHPHCYICAVIKLNEE